MAQRFLQYRKTDDIQFPVYGFYDGFNNRLHDEYGKRMWKHPALLGLSGYDIVTGSVYVLRPGILYRIFLLLGPTKGLKVTDMIGRVWQKSL